MFSKEKEHCPATNGCCGKGKKIFVITWLVFSFLYIVWDLWNDGLRMVHQAGQVSGYEKAVTDLISRAKTDCNAFDVHLGENKVDLVNVACLKQSESAPSSEVPALPQK